MLTIASVSRPPGVFAGVGARAELVLYGANLLPLDLRADDDLPEPPRRGHRARADVPRVLVVRYSGAENLDGMWTLSMERL